MRIDVHTHFQSLDFIKHLQGRNTLPKTLLEGGTYAVHCAPGLQIPSLPKMVDQEDMMVLLRLILAILLNFPLDLELSLRCMLLVGFEATRR